jgi:hypothetical protein
MPGNRKNDAKQGNPKAEKVTWKIFIPFRTILILNPENHEVKRMAVVEKTLE